MLIETELSKLIINVCCNEFFSFLKLEENMKINRSIKYKNNRTKQIEPLFNIKEKAAFEMLLQRKNRQINKRNALGWDGECE
tara:strand:- start:187 stop:432 length:246 start_codon:yes stop_codon:yes gene_type:complete